LQPVLNNLALATLTGFVAALGAAHLAGFGAAVRLEYLLYPLAFGLGAGVIAMVGTNIGAGNVRRAERIAWTGAALGFCWEPTLRRIFINGVWKFARQSGKQIASR